MIAPPRGNISRTQFFEAVADELERAYAKHGAEPWGRHEFYAILKEEVDELWDDIKADAPTMNLYKEAVQVVAMCVRYFETDDRYRGWHWGQAEATDQHSAAQVHIDTRIPNSSNNIRIECCPRCAEAYSAKQEGE